jgi:hypothetical protein
MAKPSSVYEEDGAPNDVAQNYLFGAAATESCHRGTSMPNGGIARVGHGQAWSRSMRATVRSGPCRIFACCGDVSWHLSGSSE